MQQFGRKYFIFLRSQTFSIKPLSSNLNGLSSLQLPPLIPPPPIPPPPTSNTTLQNSGISRFLESKYKCHVCKNVISDPRVLECLHSFCCNCLIELEAIEYGTVNQFWSKPTDESEHDWPSFSHSGSVVSHDNCNANEDIINTMSISSTKSTVSRRKSLTAKTVRGRNSSAISILNKPKYIICPKCGNSMELPIGGVERLLKNYVLARQTNEALCKIGSEHIEDMSLCDLCNSGVKVLF